VKRGLEVEKKEAGSKGKRREFRNFPRGGTY